MISFGNNLRNNQEPLVQMEVGTLYEMIHNPEKEFADTIGRLRLIRSIDEKKYAMQKTQLPFFVCARFEPAARRVENFASTEYFVVDIDHLSSQDIILADLKIRLKRDPRVVMCYASPSLDGLKVLFRLSEKCFDPGQYKLFYKLFVEKLAEEYSIGRCLDARTCDVTRACFLSADETAYFNPDAEAVEMDDYMSMCDSQQLWDVLRGVEASVPEYVEADVEVHDPDEETMSNIRALLNPAGRKQKPVREVYVPQVLNDLIASLSDYINGTGLEVSEVIDIQYGKKLRIFMRNKQAEVNLFYGKRGFSVVQSPRTGTDPELNGICAELIQSFVDVA